MEEVYKIIDTIVSHSRGTRDKALVVKDRTAPCNGTSNLKYTDET